MPTERKIETVADLRELIAKAQMAVGAEYRGLTVAEMNQLRRALRQAGVEAHVVKNRLFQIAATEAGREDASALAEGPTMVVFVPGDIVAAARSITDYVKSARNAFQPRKVYMPGQVMDAGALQDLAELPPREALIGQLAGAFMSPLSRLKGMFDQILTNPAGHLLNGVLRDTTGLLEARAAQLGG